MTGAEEEDDYSEEEEPEDRPSPVELTPEESRLISAGEEFLRKLQDPDIDPCELQNCVRDAVVAKEFPTMLRARDARGRTALHLATSRGDLRLCKEMVKADPELVNAVDSQRNTPLMEASLHGRGLIVEELVKAGADVTRKNKDLMTALSLACVNEGAGNGDVVQQLLEAGADPSQLCWQTSPLMAAADSGHFWALQILIEMGADPWLQNSSGMTALDFARDMETAQFLHDVMVGDKLSNKPAPRINTQNLFKDAEARRARLHKAAREVALEDAFAALEVSSDLLEGFRESGANYNELRKAWHRICLTSHPDKLSGDLEGEAQAEAVARFQSAVAAFEAIERHYRQFQSKEEEEDDEGKKEQEG